MSQGTEFLKPLNVVEDRFLGARAAAKECGISYQTMLSLIKKGKIKAVPMGSRFKISMAELERFKEQGNRNE